MNTKVTSVELIKPSQPTPTHLRYLKASLFDHANTPVLMPLIFFYTKRHVPSTSTILDRLKNSLPATLSVFYPLAGRVHGTSCIDCNDEGVPYIEAKVTSICLSEIVHVADVSLLDELLPSHGDDQGGYEKLLLAIQVNAFMCGGVAIGIKMSHTISDAFSFAMFARTWASIASDEAQSISPSPLFEIWKQFPPHPSKSGDTMSIAVEDLNPDLITNKLVAKWFMFSKEMCNVLGSRICSDYKVNQNQPSLTMVLSAFLWSRIKLACKRTNDDKSIPHEVYHAVNIRPKLKALSNSYYYFGNMVVNAIAKPSLDDNDKSLCNSFLTTMGKSIEKIIGQSGFIERLEKGKEDLSYITEHFERESRGEIVSLGFSSLRSLPMYESDFGWGKPVWVTSATLVFNGTIIMIPGHASSDDTYAYVNLRPHQMACLEADQEFLSFVSKSSSSLGSFGRSKI
ncbi:hypothetical protein vseg_018103 [Gypsophila vaccaria]